MASKLRVLGKLVNSEKREVADKIVKAIEENYPDIEGEVYLGYPIYVDEITKRNIGVDIAIISKIGVFIFNILCSAVTDYSIYQDDIYARIEAKFKKQHFLFKRKKLIFSFDVITYSLAPLTKIEDCLLAQNVEEVMDYIKILKQGLFSDDLYEKIISGIQEAYGLNAYKERGDVSEGTKAFSINKMSSLIEKYDIHQMDAILSDTTGIQRIRGMAGSGKTIILARKAVELHTAHPEWNIVLTYSTRSLKEQLLEYIGRFYAAKNDGAKYDDKKLKVMQAWGSASSRGVYYDICLKHGISPLNLGEARAKYGNNANHFSRMCVDIMRDVDSFNKMYDCILIDEAQDFDKNFMKLCLNVLGENQRLVYAYDELQKLNEEEMPSPEEIFGQSIQNDTPLTVCYRNQGRAIVTAHALGMGLYSKEGLLQLPGSSSVWQAIGYFSDSTITEGGEVALYRTSETSPKLLEVDPDDILLFHTYDESKEMYKSLLDMIKNDLEDEGLLPNDIMIIDMETLTYNDNCIKLQNAKFLANDEDIIRYKFDVHVAGAANPEDFFRETSVVYSSVRRAKGNEAFIVYIINAHKCINSLTRRSDRNALFTAITRSKGWVRVLGYGVEMESLIEEFNEIKNHNYELYFKKYPTKEEQKQLVLTNRDLAKKEVETFEDAKTLINKLRSERNIPTIQIVQELLGVSKNELKNIFDKTEEA